LPDDPCLGAHRGAGSAAGYAAKCDVDAAPILAAFNNYLQRERVIGSEEMELRKRLSLAQASTIASLDRVATDQCADVHAVVLKAVRGLNE
jgi:hypothetical protein